MKSLGSLFTVIVFMVFGQMCNDNESEENQTAEPSAIEHPAKVTGEDSETDLKQFMASANQMIILSENNLKTLRFKIKNAENPNNKIKWKMVYNTSEYKIKHLKQRWERRESEVILEVKKSKNTPTKADSLFTTSFIREMAKVNREMEKVIDE